MFSGRRRLDGSGQAIQRWLQTANGIPAPSTAALAAGWPWREFPTERLLEGVRIGTDPGVAPETPSEPTAMTGKPTPRVKPASKAPAKPPVPPPATGRRQPETRWQRTARYGWDKGGSKGGR